MHQYNKKLSLNIPNISYCKQFISQRMHMLCYIYHSKLENLISISILPHMLCFAWNIQMSRKMYIPLSGVGDHFVWVQMYWITESVTMQYLVTTKHLKFMTSLNSIKRTLTRVKGWILLCLWFISCHMITKGTIINNN